VVITCCISTLIIEYINKANGNGTDHFDNYTCQIVTITGIFVNIPVFDVVRNEVKNNKKDRGNNKINKGEVLKHACRRRKLKMVL
jgi:hypothetical protein